MGLKRNLTYDDLTVALRCVLGGAKLIGTNHDATFPSEDGLMPGNGSIVASIERASGQTAHFVGKPYAPMYEIALDRLQTAPHETLMIGDRLDTDIAGRNSTPSRPPWCFPASPNPMLSSPVTFNPMSPTNTWARWSRRGITSVESASDEAQQACLPATMRFGNGRLVCPGFPNGTTVTLQRDLNAIIGEANMGIDVMRLLWNGTQLDEVYRIQHNATQRFPSASCFKAWLTAYYYTFVPPTAWQDQPGTPLYQAIVNSNNTDTGTVFSTGRGVPTLWECHPKIQ
ncbi:MAG UNVERIFIED_CONTAM: HAD hydrolase-like protein [Anaerolineae bacterium]|jgi:hypothetical protein